MNEQQLLHKIRDRSRSSGEFRRLAAQLSLILARKTLQKIPVSQRQRVALVLVLRSSIAMLPAFLKYFPHSTIGFLGYKRDERTARAKKYYENLQTLNRNSVVVVPDPMLATGGTLTQVLKVLIRKGVKPENIYFTGFLAARPGWAQAAKIIPPANLTLLAVDSKLDRRKFIAPGLGDFGDRYFGL